MVLEYWMMLYFNEKKIVWKNKKKDFRPTPGDHVRVFRQRLYGDGAGLHVEGVVPDVDAAAEVARLLQQPVERAVLRDLHHAVAVAQLGHMNDMS